MRLYKEVTVKCKNYTDYKTYKLIFGKWIRCILPVETISIKGHEESKDESQGIYVMTSYYIGN
jgi:hypothetical protein